MKVSKAKIEESRAGYRRGTKMVCIKILPEQHAYLKEQAKKIGKRGMSEVVRQILAREMEANK